jgi:hypothetical protein
MEPNIADRLANFAIFAVEMLDERDEPGESREILADAIVGLHDPAALPPRLRKLAADITVLLDDHEREQGAADRREWARTIAYDFTAPGKRLDEMSVDELEHEVERRVKYGAERGLIA